MSGSFDVLDIDGGHNCLVAAAYQPLEDLLLPVCCSTRAPDVRCEWPVRMVSRTSTISARHAGHQDVRSSWDQPT